MHLNQYIQMFGNTFIYGEPYACNAYVRIHGIHLFKQQHDQQGNVITGNQHVSVHRLL